MQNKYGMLQAIMYNYVNQNVKILQGKVEDKISNEARQRHITEKLRNFGHGIAGHYSEFFCLINLAYRAMANFYG